MSRAALALALLALAATLLATLGPSTLSQAQPRSDHVDHQELRLPAPWGEARVVLTHSRSRGRHPASTTRLPIVIALHGAGEARRGPERGFLGWVTDYHLPDAFAALARGQLTPFSGALRRSHLAAG